MAKKTVDSPFSKFFNEESQDYLEQSGKKGKELTFKNSGKYPLLIESTPAEEPKMIEEWKNLRKFFISSKGGGLPQDAVSIHLKPELMSKSTILQYPVCIANNSDGTLEGSNTECSSLSNLISGQIDKLYPEPGQGTIIKNVFPRIVLETGELLNSDKEDPTQLQEVFERASNTIKSKMELRGADKDLFEEQISEIKSAIPADCLLIPYSPNALFDILQSALNKVTRLGFLALEERIRKILKPLVDILAVENENDPEATDAQHLQASIGFADNYLDFEQLSSVIPESASEHISKDRFARIKGIIETLQEYKKESLTLAKIVIQNDLFPDDQARIKKTFPQSEVSMVAKGKLCTNSINAHNKKIDQFAKIVKALRIGELELGNRYLSEVHDDFFDSFDWNSFTSEEISFCPPVVLIADPRTFVTSELKDFSTLLFKNIPIKLIALKGVWSNGDDITIDPVALAISYRNTYVVQSTLLNPENLFQRFADGLSTMAPSYFQIEVPELEIDEEALIELSVSVESRAFPGFVYNGKIGTAWGSRFDITDNPQNEKNWPVYEYPCKNNEGKESKIECKLTYADFLSLNSTFRSNYRIVASEFWTDDLLDLSQFLTLPERDQYGKVPFIWMVDKENNLIRTAVSWNIVEKATERIEFWHYLQDSGGVNSYHAQKALKVQEEKILKETEKRIENLKAEHLAMLEEVRKESAEQAMDQLTSALLDLDTEAVLKPSATQQKPKSEADMHPISEETPEQKIEVIEEQEEETISEEPWIETPLCTNCNECTDINNRMFNYNANKLAFIADPTAGTFAQLVEAAEKCPVSIIHPGKPLNPDEPDLEDLIKRAKKFN